MTRMDVREKLVEIVKKAAYSSLPSNTEDFHLNMFVTNLLSHGVTVLPVQVGDTVYGRFLPYGEEVQQCEVVKSKLCQFKDRTVRYLLDLEFNIIDPYFNDGRLMRCSTQAVYGADFGNWYRVYLTHEEAESTPPKGE